MRIVDTIPHPSLTISIFQMNDKYLVKFEAGAMMEQTFKFYSEDVGSLQKLKELVNEDFIEKVRLRFNDMYAQLKASLI